MSKKKRKKTKSVPAENNRNQQADKRPDDYDFQNAVYPDNSQLSVPSEEKTDISHGDIVMRKAGKDALIGEYNFINFAVLFVAIMLMGLSFALLRNTGEYIEKNNKISYETIANGKFTKRLSKNYLKRLPGKQLLLDANSCFSYAYGFSSYNDEKNFVDSDTGKIIGVKTYEDPFVVTLTTKATEPSTTTQYTGKTTNTTKKLTGTLFVGPGQLTTTTKTKKTTTKKTTKKTTSVTTTAFTGTTWSFKGTTTQATESTVQTTTAATTTSSEPITEESDNTDYEYVF